MIWTRDLVEERIAEAFDTLAKLSMPGLFPAGAKSSMPAPVQRVEDWWPQPGTPNFAIEWEHAQHRLADERHSNRPAPSLRAVTEMEEALSWQFLVAQRKHFRALAGWALTKGRMGKVARKLGIHRNTALAWRRQAANEIATELNRRPKNRWAA